MRLKAVWLTAALVTVFAAGCLAGRIGAQGPGEPVVEPTQDEQALAGPEQHPAAARNLAIFGVPARPFHARKGDDLVQKTGKECRDCHVGRCYPQGDFFGWEARKKWQVHWILFSFSGFVALTGIFASVSIWSMGRGPSLHHAVRWPAVASSLFWEVILGRRIWRQSRLRWAIFLLVSMGFVSLAVVFSAMAVTRYLFTSSFFLSGAGGILLDFLADFLGACILAGTLLALYRRCLRREEHMRTEGEDIWILLLLAAIVLTGFFLEGSRLAVVAPEPRTAASFVGFAIAQAMKAWSLPWTPVRFYVWILHAALVFAFFAYLPFSKLFHLITCPVSVLATASEASYRQRQ